MSKKLMSIVVRGKTKEWFFMIEANPKYLQEWIDDGLDIHIVENIIPEWIVNLGITKPFVFLQDIFNFKNPWNTK